jgi:hypothetical protein
MQTGAFIRAVQMMGVDVGQVTANLAITKAQLEDCQEAAKDVNVAMWSMPGTSENQPTGQFVLVPIGQYQAVMRLLDALG